MKVSEIQEWVTYHGFSTKVDNIMGPATRKCVQMFQKVNQLPNPNGEVDAVTEKLLIKPLLEASTFVRLARNENPLDQARRRVVEIARLQLDYKAREIGGENRGPWVRLYMGGRHGREWPWCAGFATWCLKMACWQYGVSMPIPYAFGCDYLAGIAQARNRFTDNPKLVFSGHFFLVRKAPNDWQHIGIVEDINLDAGVMITLEGNTNDEGSPEGFEVCRRYRSITKRDFIIY